MPLCFQFGLLGEVGHLSLYGIAKSDIATFGANHLHHGARKRIQYVLVVYGGEKVLALVILQRDNEAAGRAWYIAGTYALAVAIAYGQLGL